MRKLNKAATAIFVAMIDQIPAGEYSVKIDNNKPDSGLMAVHVEDLQYKLSFSGMTGRVISVAHYYEQNGDLMRDPDVEFLFIDNRTEDQDNLDLVGIYPISYRQDGLGIDRQDAIIENGKITKYRAASQKDCTLFCNGWMMNIKHQQGIKPIKNAQVKTGKPQIHNIYDQLNRAAKSIGFKSMTAAIAAGKTHELTQAAEKMGIR